MEKICYCAIIEKDDDGRVGYQGYVLDVTGRPDLGVERQKIRHPIIVGFRPAVGVRK